MSIRLLFSLIPEELLCSSLHHWDVEKKFIKIHQSVEEHPLRLRSMPLCTWLMHMIYFLLIVISNPTKRFELASYDVLCLTIYIPKEKRHIYFIWNLKQSRTRDRRYQLINFSSYSEWTLDRHCAYYLQPIEKGHWWSRLELKQNNPNGCEKLLVNFCSACKSSNCKL